MIIEVREANPKWLRVYNREIKRRNAAYEESSKNYFKVFGPNLKPLQDACEEHVWVPATHLWIHDEKKQRGAFTLEGIRRRSFAEASPYVEPGGVSVTPQICWNCCEAAREIRTKKTTYEEREQVTKANKKEARARKRRLRKSPVDCSSLFGS